MNLLSNMGLPIAMASLMAADPMRSKHSGEYGKYEGTRKGFYTPAEWKRRRKARKAAHRSRMRNKRRG